MTVSFYVSEAIPSWLPPPGNPLSLQKSIIFYLDKLLHIFEIEQELGAHPQIAHSP